MALVGDVGEFVAIFQSLGTDESAHAMLDRSRAERVRDEVADVSPTCCGSRTYWAWIWRRLWTRK